MSGNSAIAAFARPPRATNPADAAVQHYIFCSVQKGARIFSLGTLSTAIAGFSECDKLSVYARTFLTDHRVKSGGSGNAPELTLRAVATASDVARRIRATPAVLISTGRT